MLEKYGQPDAAPAATRLIPSADGASSYVVFTGEPSILTQLAQLAKLRAGENQQVQRESVA